MLQRILCFLALLYGCNPPSSDPAGGETLDVRLKAGTGVRGELLSVTRGGDTLTWNCDTLAVAGWWDEKGKKHTAPVSSGSGWIIKKGREGSGYRMECSQPQLGFSFTLLIIPKGDILEVRIPEESFLESGSARFRTLRLLPRFGAATEGEPGYLVLAKGSGIICHFRDKEPKEHWENMYGFIKNCTMPLFGIVRGNNILGGIIVSGQYDTRFCISTNWGEQRRYAIDPEFTLRSFTKENRLPEDLTVQYHFLTSPGTGWMALAKRYRQYNFDHRGILPLRQRAAASPELDYSSGAMEVRLRLGVKPIPYEIKEQTPETEPPVRVFLTFRKVREIMDEFHKQGIGETEFCLVGWNIGGHDGRYPQIFPVEPALGGEDELKKTISHGQSLGYQIVAHNNHYDAFSIAEDWDEKYIRKKADGQLYKGGQWGGGQSYNICLSQAYELFAKRDLPLIRDLGFKGLHYSDVLSIVGPRPCYDPLHPETRRQDAEATNKILALAKEIFGGIQSEGGLDYAAPVLDRMYCLHSGAAYMLQFPYVDGCIPFYPAVYHGVMLYNLSPMSLNSLPGEEGYLRNIEYGGLPLIYFYKFFVDGAQKSIYANNRDFFYENRESLRKTVADFKRMYDDLLQVKHLQYEFIEDHRQLSGSVFETVYSNGHRVVVNYGDHSFTLPGGESVPPKGFYLLKKGI